jgi:hypothetical protein
MPLSTQRQGVERLRAARLSKCARRNVGAGGHLGKLHEGGGIRDRPRSTDRTMDPRQCIVDGRTALFA